MAEVISLRQTPSIKGFLFLNMIVISQFEELGKSLRQKVNIGIRLNPDIDGKTLDKISTGRKTNSTHKNCPQNKEDIKKN